MEIINATQITKPDSSPSFAQSKSKRARTSCLTCRERKLKCDEGLPRCKNCKQRKRQCKRGVRLNFIDVHCERPPYLLPLPKEWTVSFQDDSRDIASRYSQGFERYGPLTTESTWSVGSPRVKEIEPGHSRGGRRSSFVNSIANILDEAAVSPRDQNAEPVGPRSIIQVGASFSADSPPNAHQLACDLPYWMSAGDIKCGRPQVASSLFDDLYPSDIDAEFGAFHNIECPSDWGTIEPSPIIRPCQTSGALRVKLLDHPYNRILEDEVINLDQPVLKLFPTSDYSTDRTTVVPAFSEDINVSEGEMSFMGMNDSSGADNTLLAELNTTTLKYISELAENILDSCIRWDDSSTSRQQATSRSGTSSTSSQSSEERTPPTSYTTNTLKRSRDQDGDNDDSKEDGEPGKRQELPGKAKSGGPQCPKLFACPYAKVDPLRYSKQNLTEPKYRNCTTSYLRDISRLKQHLYRVHALPKHYCLRCYDEFHDQERFRVHARQDTICAIRAEPLFKERMTEDQYNRVHRRVVPRDPEQLWFMIFETLFPESPKPSSPYASTADPVALAHFVELFRAVGPAAMLDFMRDRREQAGGSLQMELPTQMLIDEAFELAAPRYVEALGRAGAQAAGAEHANFSSSTVHHPPYRGQRLCPAASTRRHPAETANQQGTIGAVTDTSTPLAQLDSRVELSELPRENASQSVPGREVVNVSDTQNWSNWFNLDPSEVNDGFDNYAMVQANGSVLPTTWASLPEVGSFVFDDFGGESLL